MKLSIIFTLLILVFTYGVSAEKTRKIEDTILATSPIEINMSNDLCISKTKRVFIESGFDEAFILEMETIVTAKNDSGMFSVECMSNKNLAYVSISHIDQGMNPINSLSRPKVILRNLINSGQRADGS